MSVVTYLRAHQDSLICLPILLVFFLARWWSWHRLKLDLDWNKDKIDNRLSNFLIVLGLGLSFYLGASTDHSFFLKPPKEETGLLYAILSWGFVILGCFLRDWSE